MKRISKKLIISLAALLFISLSSFAMLSYTLADEINGANDKKVATATDAVAVAKKVGADNSSNKVYTQIDRIIENSNDASAKDPIYHIIEITSGSKSSLEKLVSDGVFKNLVIDGYRSIEAVLKDGSAEYKSYSVATDDSDDIVAAIKGADFIYVHNDPNSMYSNTVDFSNDVKEALDAAATVNYKPFIIDSFVRTYNISQGGTNTYNSMLANDIPTKYYKYPWPNTLSLADFMTLKSTTAFYIPIHGNTAKASVWEKYEKSPDSATYADDKYYYVAKVLTINVSSTTMTDKMKSGIPTADITAPTDLADGVTMDTTGVKAFSNTSDLYKNGYNKVEKKPDYIKFDRVAADADLSSYDLSTYDFIVLEGDLNNKTIGKDTYNSIIAAAKSNVHILFDSALSVKANIDVIIDNPAPAYAYVLDKVATSSGIARYGNVLVCDSVKMEQYASATKPKSVNDIAQIIINGRFRGYDGFNSGDGTSNIYTVLEIEPSYPIDYKLAKAFYNNKTYDAVDKSFTYDGQTKTFLEESGRSSKVLFDDYKEYSFYYLRSDDVYNYNEQITSSDDISIDNGVTAISSYETQADYDKAVADTQKENTSLLHDYYNWTVTKAKIAHAKGVKGTEVKIVHMSSAEFNSSRLNSLDGYDAIYIGGDTSGIKVSDRWQNNSKYTMYYTDGDDNTTIAQSNGAFRSNDISNQKLEELKKYAASLPVIVDKSVTDAITAGNGISPDTNMYKFVTSIKDGAYTLWGFDSSQTIKVVNEGEYGNPINNYATIFNNKTITEDYLGNSNEAFINSNPTMDENTLADLLKRERPRAVFTKMPIIYRDLGDDREDYWITKDDFVWNYEVQNATDVTAKLYVDENADGQFDDTEERGSASGAKATLKPKASTWVGDDYYGPIYWKVVVTNNATKTSTSYTGMSKIKKRPEQEKMKVDLLEIQPCVSGGDNGSQTLTLCTECQMGRCNFMDAGNIYVTVNQGKYSNAVLKNISGSFRDTGWSPSNVNGTSLNLLKLSDYTPETITVYYQNTSGPVTNGGNDYYVTQNLSEGGTISLSNCNSGVLKVGNHSGKTLRVTSGGTTLSGTEVSITVAADGIVKIQFPSTHTESGTTTKKYIIDYLPNADDTYNYKTHGNVLGIHEHKFGIVEYMDHETRSANKNATGENLEGLDDVNSNLFLNFQDDYDVDTTIWSVEQYQDWCSTVNNLYAGLSADEIEAKKETFSQAASAYKNYYDCMVEVINGIYFTNDSQISAAVKQEFVDFLRGKDSSGNTVSPALSLGASFSDNKLTYKSNPSVADVEAMLKAFAKAGENCDKCINENRDSWKNDGKLKEVNTDEQIQREFDYLADPSVKYDDKAYYFIYSLYATGDEKVTPTFTPYYVVWRDAKILEQFFHYEYMENNLRASVFYGENASSSNLGKFDLSNAFNCIVLGAAEGFGGKDINTLGCQTLLDYIDQDGHLILFHDSLVVKGTNGNTETMTNMLSESFGQAKVSDTAKKKNGFSVTARSLLYKEKDASDQKYYNPIQKYVFFDWERETNLQTNHGAHDVRKSIHGTGDSPAMSDKANQVNEGVITIYPFNIKPLLQISPTSASGYTSNVDEKEVVVYYTVSGGTNGTYSSMFVSNPNDGANNYFLYQYHNVTYTGAGHTLITGLGRQNNDERKLFINVILNAARKSTVGPSLSLHDFDSMIVYDAEGKVVDDKRTNKVIKIADDANQESENAVDKDDYMTYVSSTEDVPTFTFYPTAPSGVKKIRIWYDVDNNGMDEKNVFNDPDDGGEDVMIYEIDSDLEANGIASEKLKKISNETGPVTCLDPVTINGVVSTKLNLKPSYFTGTNNVAYICVEMTDGKGKTVVKNIRIQLKEELLDLN
ncbi:hypothetical protein SAMN06297422_11152 [Lachnospiraceae bacterium]|nr:hypothetical protein SAMN06297422_11152 [Lachnospiraceae bacterium]